MTKIILGFFIVFIFIGCTIKEQNAVVYERYQPKVLHVKKEKNITPIEKRVYTKSSYKKSLQKAVNGVIKGNITKLVYGDGVWNYTVKGADTSNGKLAYAEFQSRKKYANSGDLVYAFINNGILKEIFLVKKANYKKKIVKKSSETKVLKKTASHKRTKNRQVFKVPTSEKINLD